MKKNLLYIRYKLLCVSFIVAALFMACSDDDIIWMIMLIRLLQ